MREVREGQAGNQDAVERRREDRLDPEGPSPLQRALLQRKLARRLQRKAAEKDGSVREQRGPAPEQHGPSLERHGRSERDNAALQQATADIPDQDVIYEQLAHNIAKGRMDPAQLLRWGYLKREEFEDAATGLRMVAFGPAPVLEPELVESAARQRGGRPLRPVIAFRGTDNKAGVLDDMSVTGIGTYQYSHAEGEITRMLGSLAGDDGKVDVVGHSLGGALAQLCAARNPGLIGRVVTFQAPGINASEVKKLADYNARAPDDKKVGATHYRMDNDLVHQAGQAHLAGDVYKFHLQGADSALSHRAFPLAELNAARGGRVEGTLGSKQDFGPDGRPLPGAHADRDRLHHVDHTTADADRGSFIRSSSEAVRVGAGLVKGLASRLTGNQSAASMEPYVRAWDEVKRMRDGGAPTEALVARIDGDKALDEDQRAQMKENLRAMYGGLT